MVSTYFLANAMAAIWLLFRPWVKEEIRLKIHSKQVNWVLEYRTSLWQFYEDYFSEILNSKAHFLMLISLPVSMLIASHPILDLLRLLVTD